jgi:SAM-dependent methyltransferase
MSSLQRLGAEEYNRRLFDRTWSMANLIPPDVWPTWPMYRSLADAAPRRLEIGPGIHPKLPIAGTHAVDLSPHALSVLAQHGAIAHEGRLDAQGFAAGSFDLVGIFEVLEHVDDDVAMLGEIARILSRGGMLAIDVPLHMRYFSAFDRLVGHVRRYEPAELQKKLESAGFEIVRFEARHLMWGKFVMFWMALFVRLFPRLSLRMMEEGAAKARQKLGIAWKEGAAEFAALAERASDVSVICRRCGDDP